MVHLPQSPPAGPCRRLVVCALLSVAATAACPQPCNGPLPDAASAGGAGGKFRLIDDACPSLGAPLPPRRAAQLGLTEGAGSVTIALDDLPLAPAAAPPATPSARPVANAPLGAAGERVLALAPALTAAARAHDLDPLLLHAIAHIESRHNARAVSPAGARGVMQVMPATAQRFGVADPERSLFDADTNLRASAALLRTLRLRFGDDLRLVLAAYNAGEGAVEKHGRDVPPYRETQAYVRDVLAVYRRLQSSFAVSATGTLVARGDAP